MERGGNKVTCKDGEKRWDVNEEGEGEDGGGFELLKKEVYEISHSLSGF